VTLRRRADDGDDSDAWRQRDDPAEFRLGWNGKSISAQGVSVMLLLLIFLVLLLLGTFAKFGLDSPVITRNGAAAQTMNELTRRLPESKQEHRDILEEIAITNYLLAECLRSQANCPRLRIPPRLSDRIIR
jgi:hypothetical protein